MRRYLLDSGPLSAYLLGRSQALSLVKPWIVGQEVGTTFLSYGEVFEYTRGLPDSSQRQSELRRLLREIHPYPLNYAIMERYADLRRRMRPPHGSGLIGDVDTLIAATALEQDLALVTMDRHFERVPDLHLMFLDRRS